MPRLDSEVLANGKGASPERRAQMFGSPRRSRFSGGFWQASMEVLKYPAYAAVVNVCVLVASLPGVTWFASATAGYESLRLFIVDGDDEIVRNFVRALRRRFRQKIFVGVLMGAMLLVITANLLFLHSRDRLEALPFYVLNLAFGATWITATAALVQNAALPGASIRRLILVSVAEGVRLSVSNVVICVASALSGLLVLFVPLISLFFSASLVLGVLVVVRDRKVRKFERRKESRHA